MRCHVSANPQRRGRRALHYATSWECLFNVFITVAQQEYKLCRLHWHDKITASCTNGKAVTYFFLSLFAKMSTVGLSANLFHLILWTLVQHKNSNVNMLLPFTSPADPLSLHQVGALSQAGGVTQEDGKAADVQRRLHYVPGGPSDGRHNGCRSLACVEKRWLIKGFGRGYSTMC